MGLFTKKKVVKIGKSKKNNKPEKKLSFNLFKSKNKNQTKDAVDVSSQAQTTQKKKPKEKFTYKFLMTKQKNTTTTTSEIPALKSNSNFTIISKGLFTKKIQKPIKQKKQQIKSAKKSLFSKNNVKEDVQLKKSKKKSTFNFFKPKNKTQTKDAVDESPKAQTTQKKELKKSFSFNLFKSKNKTQTKDAVDVSSKAQTTQKKEPKIAFSFLKKKETKPIESENIKDYSDEAKSLLITGALKTSASEFPYEKKLKKFKFKPESVSTSINGMTALSLLLIIIISSYFYISQSVLSPILSKQRDNIKTQEDLEQKTNTLNYQIPALNKKIEEINNKVSFFDTKAYMQNDLDKLYADLTAASLEYDVKMSFSEKDSRPLSVSSKSKEALYKVINVVLSVEASYINYLKFRYKALVESGMNVRILTEKILSINDDAGGSQSSDNMISDEVDSNLLINLSFEVLEKVN